MTICSPLDAITVYMFLGHYNRFIAHDVLSVCFLRIG